MAAAISGQYRAGSDHDCDAECIVNYPTEIDADELVNDEKWQNLIKSFDLALKDIIYGADEASQKALVDIFKGFETESLKTKCLAYLNDFNIGSDKVKSYSGLTNAKAIEISQDLNDLSVYDNNTIRSFTCLLMIKDLYIMYDMDANGMNYKLCQMPCYFAAVASAVFMIYTNAIEVKYQVKKEKFPKVCNTAEERLLFEISDLYHMTRQTHAMYHIMELRYLVGFGSVSSIVPN